MKKVWMSLFFVSLFLFQLYGGCSSPADQAEKSPSEKVSAEKKAESSGESPSDTASEIAEPKGESDTAERTGEPGKEKGSEGPAETPKAEPGAETPADGGAEPTAEVAPEKPSSDGGPEPSAEVVPDSPKETLPEVGPEKAVAETAPEAVAETTPGEVTPEGPGAGGPKPTAAAQIKSVRGGNVGTIDGAAVTYIKPAVGKESGGFFVQATKTGPAIFVALDPSKLNPALSVGDIISFKADKVVTTREMLVAVTAISNLKVLSKGFDVTKLQQDLSSTADLVSNLGDYESEFISVTGTVESGPLYAGTGFRAFQVNTAAIKGDKNLKVRLPETLALGMGMLKGCQISIAEGVVWRYRTQVQLSAFRKAEVFLKSCPAPKVLKATATSPTTVEIQFSRPLDPKSVQSNGSQFTFSGGLKATAVKVNGKVAAVTTTSQVGGKSYTVTVAPTVKDDLGKPIDPNANTATFIGFQQPAKILINEVNANISYGCDLIELRVISGGSVDGFVLLERNYSNPIYKFPAVTFKKDQFIVIHLNGKNPKCNSKGAKDELKDPKAYPKAQYPENYDTAFDVYSQDSGLTSTDNVLTLVNSKTGKIIDAVLLTGKTGGSAASSSEAQAAVVAKAKEWTDPNGKIPSGGFVDDQFHKNAAGNMKNCSKNPTGRSIQRISDKDTNTKADWSDKHNATWGALNPGQKKLP